MSPEAISILLNIYTYRVLLKHFERKVSRTTCYQTINIGLLGKHDSCLFMKYLLAASIHFRVTLLIQQISSHFFDCIYYSKLFY